MEYCINCQTELTPENEGTKHRCKECEEYSNLRERFDSVHKLNDVLTGNEGEITFQDYKKLFTDFMISRDKREIRSNNFEIEKLKKANEICEKDIKEKISWRKEL